MGSEDEDEGAVKGRGRGKPQLALPSTHQPAGLIDSGSRRVGEAKPSFIQVRELPRPAHVVEEGSTGGLTSAVVIRRALSFRKMWCLPSSTDRSCPSPLNSGATPGTTGGTEGSPPGGMTTRQAPAAGVGVLPPRASLLSARESVPTFRSPAFRLFLLDLQVPGRGRGGSRTAWLN